LIEGASEVFVSAASVWEAGIKAQLGKLQVDPKTLERQIGASGFWELPITVQHALVASALPRHHGDPFDRMLIAQALSEPLRLLTNDKQLPQYTDLVLMAS
jgi:PIN domain nuclease of toxin-antitoxin system